MPNLQPNSKTMEYLRDPKKKEGGGGREGERERWSLREVILFIRDVREREEKIIEERERRNAICCTCKCHPHLPPLTKFSG